MSMNIKMSVWGNRPPKGFRVGEIAQTLRASVQTRKLKWEIRQYPRQAARLGFTWEEKQ